MDNLSKMLDSMLEEFSDGTKDERIQKISDEEFQQSIKKAEDNLDKEYHEINKRRAESLREALNDKTIFYHID